MSEVVDNSIEYNPKSVQLYNNIREYAAAGYSKREIAKILHCGRNTVTKYLNGDYESLCKRDYRSGMDQFYDDIIKELNAGVSRKDVYCHLLKKGYMGKHCGIVKSGCWRRMAQNSILSLTKTSAARQTGRLAEGESI